MRKSVGLWPVCALLVCILAAFFWSNAQVSKSVKEVNEKYERSRVKLTQLQGEQTELKNTLELVGTDAFIESQARSIYGYMRPDEIRFVITNPEVLYGSGGVPVR